MNKLLLFFTVLLLVSGCNSKFSKFGSKRDKLNLNNLEYNNISLKSRIKYKDENRDLKATANIRIKRDSIIWFSLSPGLGIEAARGVVTKDSIVVLDKIHKEYQVLRISEMSEKFHFNFDLNLIESILIGNLIWPIENNDEIKKEDGYFKVKKTEGDLSILNYIGASSMKLEKLGAVSDSSANGLNIQYSEFQEINDKDVPSEILMQINYKSKRNRASKTSKVYIKHSRITLDKENMNFSFHIPSKYVEKK
jgi:hypothetical protein